MLYYNVYMHPWVNQWVDLFHRPGQVYALFNLTFKTVSLLVISLFSVLIYIIISLQVHPVLFPGFVCSRKDLSASGCCHSSGESTKRYECSDCQNNNCCSIYEHCVSCCLNPNNVSCSDWFGLEASTVHIKFIPQVQLTHVLSSHWW